MSDMGITPGRPLTRTVFKGCNITLVADAMTTNFLHANFFEDLGPAQSVTQIPSLCVIDFGRYSFIVNVDGRRAIAADASPELNEASPVMTMMTAFAQRATSALIKAIGFNFIYELGFSQPATEEFLGRFLRLERFAGFGSALLSGGFRVVAQSGDHLSQLTLDPVWDNPLSFSLKINYHFDSPGEGPWVDVVRRFPALTVDAPGLVERIIHA